MIKPEDFRNTSFKKGLFGYNKGEVDTYVDTASRAYDSLYRENEKLQSEKNAIQKELEEARIKIFELESGKKTTPVQEKAPEEKKTFSAKPEEKEVKAETEPAVEEKKDDSKIEMPKKEEKASATSKFFEHSDDAAAASSDDDDEVFVGEIEDNRKTNKVMIGDGEEESTGDDDGFEFL